jgi:hypothetical protein
VERHRHPEVLRLIYHGARFIQNASTLDVPATERLRVRDAAPAALPDLASALESRDPQAALDALEGYAGHRDHLEELRASCEDLALKDERTRPIVVAHLIKTCAAAFEETASLRSAGHRNALHPLRAFVRLAASPIRERRIAQRCYEAIRFVEEGKVPRTLT